MVKLDVLVSWEKIVNFPICKFGGWYLSFLKSKKAKEKGTDFGDRIALSIIHIMGKSSLLFMECLIWIMKIGGVKYKDIKDF